MSDYGLGSKDQNADGNADYTGYAHEILEEIEDSTESWISGYMCFVLAKKFSTFCLCPEILLSSKVMD
jgi:hypothetical protein